MSELRANTISDAAGTGPVTLTGQYAAKAWVNFNGSGTAAIRDSFNVSSLTDNGTGSYTVSFTNGFAASTYIFASANRANGVHGSVASGYSTSSISIDTRTNSFNLSDPDIAGGAAFGDLA